MTADEGIVVRPSTKKKPNGKPADPSYQARVFDKRQGKTLTRTFSGPGALAAAKKWRKDIASRLHVAPDTVAKSDPRKLEVAVNEWLEGRRSGRIKSRRGIDYRARRARAMNGPSAGTSSPCSAQASSPR